MNKLILRVPKLPNDLEFDEKLDWYLKRFGNSLGQEIAFTVFSLIEKHQEKRQIGDEIIFSFEIIQRQD